MANYIRHVSPGDKLKIRAEDWNAMADVVNKVAMAPSDSKSSTKNYARRTVTIINASTVSMAYGHFIQLISSAGGDDDLFHTAPAFRASIPTADTTDSIWAVVNSSSIAPGDTGTAIISGVAAVLVENPSSTGTWGTPDGNGALRLNTIGVIRVLPLQYISGNYRHIILGGNSWQMDQDVSGQFDLKVQIIDTGFTATVTNSDMPDSYAFAGYVHAGARTFTPQKVSYSGTSSESERWFYCELEYTPNADPLQPGTWRCEVTNYAQEQTFPSRYRLFWVFLGRVRKQGGVYRLYSKRAPCEINVIGRWV